MPFAFAFAFLKLNSFYPTRGLKTSKTHYKPIKENHCMGVFDSSNDAQGYTDSNAKKTSALGVVLLMKKSVKFCPKLYFFKCLFLKIFCFF